MQHPAAHRPAARLLALLVVMLAHGPATAAPPADPDPCTAPIEAAEKRLGIPPRLLMAIAMVETGHPNPRAGHPTPWPWALDVNGTDLYAASKAAAVQAVRDAQARGETSIDVGCMQVNLAAHPAAFASLDHALDPAENVAYAARFLVSLYRETGDWATAVGFYHSHTPGLAEPYRTRVAAVLPSGAFEPHYVKTVMDRRAAILRQVQEAWAAAALPGTAGPAPPANTWNNWAQAKVLKSEQQRARNIAAAR